MKWIKQTKEWSDCRLIAAANAALILGLNPPTPTQKDLWLALIKLAKADFGAAITPELFDQYIGVRAQEYPENWKLIELKVPSILSIFDPKAGFHAVLVAEVNQEKIGIVGYCWENKITYLSYKDLEKVLPQKQNINRKAYLISRIL